MATQVTTDSSTADAAKAAAADTAGAATEQAKAVVSTATDQAQQVVGQAKDQAASVASEARAQAQQVLGTATSELSSQLDERLSSATSIARTTSDELRALAEGRHEDAGRTGDLAHEASQRLAHLADRVDELGVRGVTEEVTDFARRRPVAFLVAAGAAGLVVGHLARAGKDAPSSPSGTGQQPATSDSEALPAATTPMFPQETDPQVPGGQFPVDPASPAFGAGPLG